MTQRRTLIALGFVTKEGVSFELNFDGWRLLKPRQIGEKDLQAARELMVRFETELPPVRDPEDPPPTMLELGEYAAERFALRINHHRYKQRK